MNIKIYRHVIKDPKRCEAQRDTHYWYDKPDSDKTCKRPARYVLDDEFYCCKRHAEAFALTEALRETMEGI